MCIHELMKFTWSTLLLPFFAPIRGFGISPIWVGSSINRAKVKRVICQGIRKNQFPGKAARTRSLPSVVRREGVRTEAALSARADPFVCLLNLGNNCRNIRVYLTCSSYPVSACNDRRPPCGLWPSLSRRDRSRPTFVQKIGKNKMTHQWNS